VIKVRIKEKREEKGMTQAELAEAMEVSQQAIAKWEIGVGMPRADKLVKLSEVLGCSLEELMKG